MKNLPYRTEWVEYPDVAALYAKLGSKNTDVRDGKPLYGLPVIYDPNTDSVVPESQRIARYLEDTYPSTCTPPLFPLGTAGFQSMFVDIWIQKISDPLHAITTPFATKQLPPRSQEYYRRTREARYGTTVEDIAPEGSERREAVWTGVRKGFMEYDKWITMNGGMFVMGDKISFADVVVVSYLTWFKRLLGADSYLWKELMVAEKGRWAKMMDVFAEWEVVDQDGLDLARDLLPKLKANGLSVTNGVNGVSGVVKAVNEVKDTKDVAPNGITNGVHVTVNGVH